ncbi:MAG: hypothetical protein MI806_12255 [Minwuiales bacterium]|nr:hypothetical protein [Minwuiales bacterium]
MSRKSPFHYAGLAAVLAVSLATSALAHDKSKHSGGIQAEKGNAELAPFDVIHAKISTDGSVAVFHMAVSGRAGARTPTPVGTVAGSDVFAYVWPTSIDPAEVGFEPKAGILAMAVTAHPDFDDTPLYDENGDGDLGNDGNVWHSHWVVLGPDEACGPGALKVIDIPEGAKPRLPKTWPGFPILLDSPGWDPVFNQETVEVRVPFEQIAVVEEAAYDGVTSGLRVNANIHSPLLCVVDVFDVASGDLSLPGKVNQ